MGLRPHTLPVILDGDYVSSKWFVNSLEAAALDMVSNEGSSIDSICERYETTYGVLLRFNADNWINGVEFPSEEEALEFLLRWS